jgi:putative ABC transport system permease protein
MNLYSFAFNNIRRTPTRTILTALSVLIAAATLTVVLSVDRGYTRAVEQDLVEKTGVHLYITKEGCPIEAASIIAQGGLSPLYVSEDILPTVKKQDGIAYVLPFQLFTATTPDGSRTDIFMGITDAIKTVRPDWIIEKGGWFESDSSIILGAQLASIENVQIGEDIYSEQFNKVFTVAAILEKSYSQDDGTFFIPLKTAQAMVSREGKLSAIAIKLNDISRMAEITTKLRANLPEEYFVVSAKELSEGILGFFAATRMIMFVMVCVAFGVSVFGIINTMLMAVMERKREIAYLKCVGARKRDILQIITIETLLLSLTGGLCGVALGLILTPVADYMLRGLLIAYVPSASIADPTWQIVAVSLLLSVSTGVICALYPAYKASVIVPMEVLRNE